LAQIFSFVLLKSITIDLEDARVNINTSSDSAV